MRQPSVLTVRNLPPEVAQAIARRAAKSGVSLNRAVIDLLREALAPRPARAPGDGAVRHHDLDHLFGSATRAEADTLDAAIREQRRVDPRDWR